MFTLGAYPRKDVLGFKSWTKHRLNNHAYSFPTSLRIPSSLTMTIGIFHWIATSVPNLIIHLSCCCYVGGRPGGPTGASLRSQEMDPDRQASERANRQTMSRTMAQPSRSQHQQVALDRRRRSAFGSSSRTVRESMGQNRQTSTWKVLCWKCFTDLRADQPSVTLCVTRPLTLFPIHPYTTPVSFCLISFFLFISPSLERTTPSRIIGTLPWRSGSKQTDQALSTLENGVAGREFALPLTTTHSILVPLPQRR